MKELQEFFRKQILSVVTYLQTTYILTCLLCTVWTIESVPKLISAWCPAEQCQIVCNLIHYYFMVHQDFPACCTSFLSRSTSVWHSFAVQCRRSEISIGTCSMVLTVCLNAYEHTSVCYTWIIFFISNDFWLLLSHSSLTKVRIK